MRHYFKSFSASGAVLTAVNHGLYIDDEVEFESSDLPAGLYEHTSGIRYYVVKNGLTEDTFGVATSKGGTVVTTTDAGTSPTYRKVNHDAITSLGDTSDGSQSGVF